jgi:hypothetical protein
MAFSLVLAISRGLHTVTEMTPATKPDTKSLTFEDLGVFTVVLDITNLFIYNDGLRHSKLNIILCYYFYKMVFNASLSGLGANNIGNLK